MLLTLEELTTKYLTGFIVIVITSSLPNSLKTLLKWVIVGSKVVNLSKERQTEIDNCIKIVSELLISAQKTDRQMKYKPQSQFVKGFYNTTETPLKVGIGLHVHQETRSKELVDFFFQLGL